MEISLKQKYTVSNFNPIPISGVNFNVDPSLERPLNGQLKMSGMVQRTNKTYVQFTRSTVNLNESKSSNSQRLEKSVKPYL